MTPQSFGAFADEPDQPTRTGKATDPEPTRTAPGAPESSGRSRGEADPLRGSRTSGFWAAVLAFVVVMFLLAVFILQNTQQVQIDFFGWQGTAPLSATVLIAAVAGALLVATAGFLRILQLRRRIKRGRRTA